MKKFFLIIAAAVASAFVQKKMKEGKNEQALWQQATDKVDPA